MRKTRILDIVEKFPETEEVFARYDEDAGKCIMCHYLFASPQDLADDIGIDINQLMVDLSLAIDKRKS